ncbi:dephospho-CoA kinase [Catenuloplanes atrovinosus]|uniref:Dephospho-CoA kinase n=1 Tax=Catenuloplanes atrovinosus TaxID=137266 RepID=A0AAE4CBG6_9ACTN|nr:dephospho-CoA kinase [Catenuloplanes atrovinosus]
MLSVGLTGGIGAGKSTVSTRLAELGAIVIDSDLLAREAVAPGSEGLAELVAALGDRILHPDGTLDRAALGDIVFADETARRTLESVIHPRVRARSAELAAAAPDDAIVVHDVPLLAESGLAPLYALVIVVETPEDIRVARLIRDRGLTEKSARARIAAQATDAQRREVADVILTNAGTREELIEAVDALWRDRLLPMLRAA